MIIRPVKEADADRVGELWKALIQHHRMLDEAMPTPAADGAYRYAQRVRNSQHDDQTVVFVAEVDGEIAGYVMGVIVDLLPEMFEEERGGFLADIYVDPAYRQQGLGRGLVKALKNWFRGREVDYFEWYVAAANMDAIAFWRTLGGRDVMLRMRASTAE